MSRMARAFVAILAVLGLVGPILGACVCPEMAPAAAAHACCPAPETARLTATHGCCADDARDDSRATASVGKALIAPGPAVAVAAVDVPLDAPAARPYVSYLPTAPLVLRI